MTSLSFFFGEIYDISFNVIAAFICIVLNLRVHVFPASKETAKYTDI